MKHLCFDGDSWYEWWLKEVSGIYSGGENLDQVDTLFVYFRNVKDFVK